MSDEYGAVLTEDVLFGGSWLHKRRERLKKAKIVWDEDLEKMGLGRAKPEPKPGNNEGPGGFCVCMSCGYRVAKRAGIPCTDLVCPRCGDRLVREGVLMGKS